MLPNGMRILHHYDGMTRMAAVNLLYGVGSRYEHKGKTGLAHLMEHLMFTGSAHVPNYDAPLQAAGGESNAWTSVDFTNYYDVLPAQNVETAFWLESDRLCALNLDETSVETQRSVVIEEFKQRHLNVPYGDLNHLIHSLAFRVHPYRWPTIGERVEDIMALQCEDIKNFHQLHYAVNNMVLCVSGNVSLDKTMMLAEKWFGELEPHVLRKSPETVEPLQNEKRYMRVNREVPQDLIYMAFRMCGRLDDDFVTCDMISDILANGMSARFTRNILAHSDLFTELDAAVEGTEQPGLFLVRGKLTPGSDVHRGEAVIKQELQKLCHEGATDDEIKKCINKYQSTVLFENMGYLPKATRLCQYEMLGDVNLVNDEVEKYSHITGEEIQRVATKLFSDANASVIHYMRQ